MCLGMGYRRSFDRAEDGTVCSQGLTVLRTEHKDTGTNAHRFGSSKAPPTRHRLCVHIGLPNAQQAASRDSAQDIARA